MSLDLRRPLVAAVLAALVLTPAMAEARVIKGNSANNTLLGTESADKISAGGGHDRINGRGGNDRIEAGSGNDRVVGGTGNDAILAAAGNDVIDAGAGHDSVNAGAGNDSVLGGDGNDSLGGGDGADRVNGGPGDDRRLSGLGGDDVILGEAGNDRQMLGDNGNDVLDGGAGNDELQGSSGNDRVIGGDGDDHAQGGPGNDRVYGGTGNDQLDGDEGDDFIDGGPGDESCPSFGPKVVGATCTGFPAAGNRIDITADAGDDVVYPGDGKDNVFGESGADLIVLTDDGAYDRVSCNVGPTKTPGDQVVYVGPVDTDDDILANCPAPQSMSAEAFMKNPAFVYPGTTTHLPLPAGVTLPRPAPLAGWLGL
ncbi:calcium-binding protein [Nocardioides sp. C4-1]|uniref:calcium-binding protein n=1 Tax=Nocardioides sp. C4-1 TaxID=3151851 RepID=UPI00326735F4